MSNELLWALLSVVPTVAATALLIERLVDLLKKGGVIKDGTSHYYSIGLNALAYVVFFLAAQAGYETAVINFVQELDKLWPVIASLGGFVIMVTTNAVVTKAVHDLIEQFKKWWANREVRG